MKLKHNAEEFERIEQEWTKKFHDLNVEFCRLCEKYESIKGRPYSEVRPVIDDMIEITNKTSKLDMEHKKFLESYVDSAIDEFCEIVQKKYRVLKGEGA